MKRALPWLIAIFLLICTFSNLPAGIIQAIIPQVVPTANKIGNSTLFQLGKGSFTSGHCTQYDANGNLVDSGTTNCGGGGAVSSVFGQTGAVNIPVTTTDISTPATPSAGTTVWYTKGGLLCSLSPGAIESCVGASGVAGVLLSGSADPGQPNPLPVQARSCVSCASLAYTTNVVNGHLLVLAAGWNGNAATSLTTISDTLGSTWTRATGATTAGNSGVVYYALANGSGADTITWTSTGSNTPVTAVGEFSGTQAVVDVQSSQAGSNGAVTTTVNNDLLVSGLAFNHSNTCNSTGAGIVFTQSNGADGICLGYQILGAPTTYTGTIQSSGAADTIFTNVAFKGTAVVTPGNNGDWYWNTTTGVLWGPKAGGTFTKSTGSFVSQSGSNGQFVLTGTPVLGTCGTSPTLATGASNTAGTINVGSGVVTACTLNFIPSFTNTPTCEVSDNSTAITSAVTAISTSSVTFSTSATIGSGQIYYHCF